MPKSNDLHQRMISHPTFADRESIYVRWYPKSLEPLADQDVIELKSGTISGAYIHIPFCDRVCRFCPFNKRPLDAQLLNAYVGALLTEIDLYSDIVRSDPLRFIYFGGGTPSTLSPLQVRQILGALEQAFSFAPEIEITLESHPSHVRPDFLRAMRDEGVNRFSSGLQSFDEAMLRSMGAQHSADDVIAALGSARSTGSNLAIDLLFRCETQTLSNWKEQLQRAADSSVNHVSLYSLILHNAERQPDPLMEAEMTSAIEDFMGPAGLRHYASCASGGFDYARPGYECQYELRHWAAPQEQYLGLGAGGIGFVGTRTTVNGLGIQRYIDVTGNHILPLVSAKSASIDELKRRFFVLGIKGLRIELKHYHDLFGSHAAEDFHAEFQQLTNWKFADISESDLVLSDLGRVNCDMVSSVFFSAAEATIPHPEETEIRRIEVRAPA